MNNGRFQDGFLWGVAAASYQIEGGSRADGKGPSVWDMFSRWPGKVNAGHTGDVACDHYHRFREDVGLMREIGAGAYRFSFSWPRVIPQGTGAVNEKGLEFYDQLIDALLEKGILPFPTLFHWDYPHALFLKGGWLNPDSPKWFGDYAALLAERFSDRISHWYTLNEPPCFLGLGHVVGIHAPGLKLDYPEFFTATKHALLGHGLACQAIRAKAKKLPHLSIAPVSSIGVPVEENEDNIEAAREYSFGEPRPGRHFWPNRIYLDPVLLGVWPSEFERNLGADPIKVTEEELKVMKQPIDSIGLNYYTAARVEKMPDGTIKELLHVPGHARSGFDWAIVPEGLYWSVRFHYERYGLPVTISENGISGLDWVSQDGGVHDPQRIDFTESHLRQLLRAHEEGYPVIGYFHWSLMDNFEWAEGYRHRFGLIHVDYETQKRTIKDSGNWYRRVAESNGSVLGPTSAVTR